MSTKKHFWEVFYEACDKWRAAYADDDKVIENVKNAVFQEFEGIGSKETQKTDFRAWTYNRKLAFPTSGTRAQIIRDLAEQKKAKISHWDKISKSDLKNELLRELTPPEHKATNVTTEFSFWARAYELR